MGKYSAINKYKIAINSIVCSVLSVLIVLNVIAPVNAQASYTLRDNKMAASVSYTTEDSGVTLGVEAGAVLTANMPGTFIATLTINFTKPVTGSFLIYFTQVANLNYVIYGAKQTTLSSNAMSLYVNGQSQVSIDFYFTTKDLKDNLMADISSTLTLANAISNWQNNGSNYWKITSINTDVLEYDTPIEQTITNSIDTNIEGLETTLQNLFEQYLGDNSISLVREINNELSYMSSVLESIFNAVNRISQPSASTSTDLTTTNNKIQQVITNSYNEYLQLVSLNSKLEDLNNSLNKELSKYLIADSSKFKIYTNNDLSIENSNYSNYSTDSSLYINVSSTSNGKNGIYILISPIRTIRNGNTNLYESYISSIYTADSNYSNLALNELKINQIYQENHQLVNYCIFEGYSSNYGWNYLKINFTNTYYYDNRLNIGKLYFIPNTDTLYLQYKNILLNSNNSLSEIDKSQMQQDKQNAEQFLNNAITDMENNFNEIILPDISNSDYSNLLIGIGTASGALFTGILDSGYSYLWYIALALLLVGLIL